MAKLVDAWRPQYRKLRRGHSDEANKLMQVRLLLPRQKMKTMSDEEILQQYYAMQKVDTFIAPDGKLYTHKKFVNWEGVREVEGVSDAFPIGIHHDMEITTVHPKTMLPIFIDFTIQD